MFTFDNIKRVIALIFVLLVSVSAEAKKFEYTVSTPEEYYNVFEDIQKIIIGTDDEIYEYIINVTDDLVLINGLGDVYSRQECDKIGKIKVKIVGPEKKTGNVKFSKCYQLFYGDYSFVNIDFEQADFRFDMKMYHVSFDHCNFNSINFPRPSVAGKWPCDAEKYNHYRTYKYCNIVGRNGSSEPLHADTLTHCSVKNIGVSIDQNVPSFVTWNTFDNDAEKSVYINGSIDSEIKNNTFVNETDLILNNPVNLYNSNNLFFENSSIKKSGASHAFRAAIEKDIVTIKGDKLPPSYLVEAFVKNSKGLAVEKIAEGVVDADGNVEIKKNINTLSEELEGISILMSPPLDVKNKGSYGFINVPFTEYYVKTNGTGHGTSWKDAMSPEDFAKKLQNCEDGTTFYLAAGLYDRDEMQDLDIHNGGNGGLIIKSSVTIKGGYPDSPEDGDTQNPIKNKTILSSCEASHSNSIYYPLFYFIDSNTSFVIDGCEIHYGRIDGEHVQSTSFRNCHLRETYLLNVDANDVEFSNCFFDDRLDYYANGSFLNIQGSHLFINSCTFYDDLNNNFKNHNAASVSANVDKATIINSTFFNSHAFGSKINVAGTIEFYNNTVVENDYSPFAYDYAYYFLQAESYDVKGNIFVANHNNYLCRIAGENNVVTNRLLSDENSLLISNSQITSLLDGRYDEETGVFYGRLSQENQLVPTVKLLNDELPDGSPIRFTRLSDVTKDANGENRQTSTCAGAVEFLSLKDYYVKTDGKGSGSSWEDAMSPEDFVKKVGNCTDGVTFHIAAGLYDKEEISKLVTFSYISNTIRFIGGYPSDAKTGSVANTKKNKTIFKGDGYFFFRINKNGFLNKEYLPIDIEISGIYFEDANLNMYSNLGNHKSINKLVIDSCQFKGALSSTYYITNELSISNSYYSDFQKLSLGGDNVSVKSSTFIGKGTISSSAKNNLFVNNTIALEQNDGGNLFSVGILVENCEFYNNTLIFNTEHSQTTSESNFIAGPKFYFKGNLFVSNGKKWSFDSSCKFEDNICSSNLENALCKSISNDGWQSILDINFDVDDNFITPYLTVKDGGFVPTIALKNDELQDGTSIRFTRLSEVAEDANGVNRLSNTCPGAVEFVKEQLQLKSAQAKIYGVECRNESGSIEVSWARKSFNSDQTFKLVVKDENGEAYESEIQDQTKGSGLFKISGLTPGTYTYKFYVKKGETFVPTEQFSISIQYQFYTAIGEAPSGNKFIIKSFVDPTIPAPEPVSMSVTHPNWCVPADGGQDYAIKKWTEGVYYTRLYKQSKEFEYVLSDLPFEEDPTETLIQDNIEPASVYVNPSSGEKTAYYEIRGLAAGSYRFVVSDGCQSWMNRVFEVKDDVQPTPSIETLVTPYTCSGVKDGAITIRVHDYYSSQSWIDDKSVVPTYWGDGYVDFTLPDQGKGDKHTFNLIDVCKKEQKLDLDMYELSKKNGLFQLTNVTAGAGRNKNDEPNGAACQVDDHRIKMKVQGGTAPYTFEIYDSKKKKVASKTVEPESGATSYVYTSGLLVPDNYVVYVSDATGCKIGDGTHANFKAKYDLSLSAYEVKCTSDPDEEYSSHIMVNGGSTGYVALYKDENDENPYIGSLMPVGKSYVDVPGTYAYGVTSFKDGCFAYSPISETPLSQSFMENLYKIEIDKPYEKKDQTCYGVNNGSFTIYPKATFENTVYGPFSFVCTLENAVTSEKVQVKEGIFNLEEPITFEDLAPGKYSAYFSYQLGECVKGKGSNFLKSAEIVAVEKPVLEEDDDEELIIRCEGATVKSTVHVKNYDKKLYTWKLTKDKVDITSTVKVVVPTEEVSAFVFKELTVGSYLFSLVDECGKSYEHSFKVGKNIKEPKEFKATYSSGITCEGKSDARLDISVTNWNTGDKGVVTNSKTNEVEKDVNEYYKGGTTSFFKYNLSGGKYTLTVNDICKKDPLVYELDLDELSKTSKFGISLADAASDAECNEDSRKLSATVSGLETQAPYTYVLYKKDGEEEKVIDDKQKEVADRTYTSAKLGYGTYKLTAVNNDGCEVSVDRTFSASHTLSGTRVVCGTNSHVELNYDGVVEGVSVKVGGKWADVKFAEGANKSIFDYNGVVTDVRVKESGCATDAALSDAKLADDLFAGVNASAVAVNQTCYGVDNGSIKVTYSGYKGNMQVVAYAFDAAGKKKGIYDANKKSLINLPPGTYEVKLGLEINGCEVADQSLSVETGLKIEGLEKPEFLEDNFSIVPNRCEGQGKGRMHLEMKGWKDGIYKWTLQRAGQTADEIDVNTHCGDKLSNGATAFDLWSLPEGKNVFTMWDACEYKYTKTADIKADYIAPLTLDTCNSKAYTCADRTDGSLTFVASPWDVEDKAVLKKGSVVIDNVKPVVKEGKAYFALANQGAGTYSIATTDLCARTDDKSIDFTAFSEKNGLLTISAEIDKDASVCEIGKRVIKVTANGGTSPYVYSVTKTDGTAVETSEALEEKTFSSQLVSAGKFKVSVTDNTECTAVYDGDLTVASETLNVKLDKYASKDQTCYGKNNAVVSVAYTGFNTELAKLRLVVTEKTEAEKKKSYEVYAETNEGTLELKTLPTGSYDVKVELVGLNGCEMNNGVLLEKEEELKPLEKPEFLEDNFSIVPNRCEGQGKGRMHLEMKGWKDGIYKWTLQRAGLSETDLEVYTHCGAKLENGATAFDLWSLPEGKNVFTMWDACDYKYTKTADIKADYIAPLTLDTCNSKAYTCADRTDGSLTFVASPWDVEDKAVLKKGSVVIDNVKPVVKEGKAYFALANQGAGTYSIATTDLCARTDDKSIDFTAFSEKNGLLTVSAEIDKDAAVCEIGKRVIKVTANGGTSPYVYSVTKTDGTAVETSEALEEKTFSSQLVSAGKYKVSVTDNTECTAVYDGDLTVASETLNVKLDKYASNDQTCYGKNNAVVSVAYTGFNTELAKLRLVVTEKTEAEKKKSYEVYAETNEGTLELKTLPTGSYDVKVELVGLNGCEMNNGVLLEKEEELKPLEKPEFLEDNFSIVPNHCEGQGKGRMHLEMKGWKDGIYKWTLQRAGQTADEIDVNTHCGDKLSNGATAFDLWSLPEGKNVFTMWDACDYKYTKTADIKADYIAPLTLDTCNSKAYTCADRADGSLTFVASPWDVEDKAVLKKGSVVIDNVKPVVKEGKAYFALANQGAGTYSIATTDLCARTDDKSIDFTAFSEKNGMLVVDVDFDAEAAKCDVDKRVFNITAKGGTAPYVYAVTKTDGTVVETSEAREATSYNSQLLADGQYKVTVTDNTECTAVYGGDLSIDPAHTMKALMREVVCDDHKNVAIVADVDNNTIIGTDYVATDAAGNVYKPLNTGIYKLFQLVGITYYQIPADVTLNGISAKVDEDCRVYSDLAELPFDKSALEKAVVTVDKVIDQRCYNVNNGELDINYSGPETSYTVAMRLKRVDVDSEETEEVDTEIQKGTDLKFKFENLAPGEYELYLVHKVGDCDAGIKPRLIQNVTIKPMPHKFERIAGDTTIQSTCYSSMNAIASIKVHGWCPEYCTWELFKDGVSLGHNTDAAPVKGDTAVWGGSELKAGAYEIKWTNYCNKTVSKDFVIDPLKEPKLSILSSSYTDLKCNYDKAHVDFHYEGGSPVNKRVLFIYEGDWEYTQEPLKEENTYRLYEFTQGPGLNGHKKVEGTTYEMTDAEKGLNQGKYTIIYQDTTKKCSGDDVSDSIYVYRPYVKLNLAKQDVLCYSENYGVINIVPTRTGKNAVSYKYMDQYPNRSDIRDQGINFGEEIFKDPSIQAEKFSDRNKFLSDVFSDVESISITCKKMTKDELYKLMQDSIAKRKTNLKYPLPKFYKDGGYEYAVSDWIGFNMMPVDMYYVTLNDIYGCQYTDSIEVKGPEDGLRVTGAKYPMGENPECNAENRRIQFTCTGGYYPYYYNVVNLDDPIADEHSTAGSGLSAADYVTGAVTEKYLVNGKQYIDYTSKMLKPGHYEVSVMDTMGCIAKWKTQIEVKAKHVLNAVPHVDVCDPANDNKLEILSSSGNASSYTLYIGHRTHCVNYPYCTVDDDNSGLVENNGKKQHIHKCEADLYKECEHFTNCLEKKAGITASNIKFKDFENNKWVAKSGYGLSGIPSGTIGVLATYSDGCKAFDEYTFKSSGLPTSVMPVAMDSVRCNGDETGAITFGLFGGHGAYKKMTLDGQDISDKTLIMFTRHEDKVGSKINYTENKIDLPVNMLLNNKSLFETLKKYYDGDALYKEAVALLGEDAPFSEISKKVSELKSEYGKTTYSFRLDNLQGTVNWNDLEKNKKHVLTVVDEQECEASMEFDIYQPTKLNITVGASVICPDGSGRIFASSTSGGVPPYEYRMNEAEPGDYEAVFNSKIGKMPKTYEGEELVHPEDYYNYYVNEYHKGDHIPAGRGVPHYMWVKDANECEMISADPDTLSEIWAWDKVQQDQLISTWHDYGDVLVVTDQTDYSMVHPDAVYDSMKVIIVMDDEGAGKFEGVMQPKEMYTYGVKNGNKVKTDFGTYTSSWGIPPLALEKYNEYLADESKHLEPIHTYFEKLVSDDAQRRMTFVKFQTPEGVDVKLADMIGNKEDYHLNFLVRVVAYVGGCDIVTEHNPLVLNLKGEDPFPDATYKSFISVDAFPNPVAKDGKCTMKVTLTNEDNEFTYSLFTLDGRRLYTKTVYPSSEHTKVEKEDGNTDYIYEVEVKGITETSIVKVTSETNTAVVKILAK